VIAVFPFALVTVDPGSLAPTILVFDSGFGGLTVLRPLIEARPDAHFRYAADDAAFPYGGWEEAALIERILAVMGRLIAETRPDLVVIACNTASTLALAPLRAAFTVPFVGTVPAIKPAAAASRSRLVSVLATPGTVEREYTRELIAQFAGDCRVTLVGTPHLAALAEAKLKGEPVCPATLAAEILPAFVETAEGRRTDQLVLACTHFPLLAEEIAAAAPWPVALVDPAPAIARRVVSLLGPAAAAEPGTRRALFTKPANGPANPTPALAQFGFETVETVALPVYSKSFNASTR
jgi:glutamate racemase